MEEKDKLILESLSRIETKTEKTREEVRDVAKTAATQGVVLERQADDIKKHIARTGVIEQELRDIARKVYIVWNTPKAAIMILTIASTAAGLVWTLHKMGVLNW